MPCNLIYYLKEISHMALFQALCSLLIQKGLYFQSKRDLISSPQELKMRDLEACPKLPQYPLWTYLSVFVLRAPSFSRKHLTKN